MQTAEELHQSAVAAINSGRLSTARRLLLRALERADSDETLARVESSLAYCSAETGDHSAGLDLCDRALARGNLTETTRGSIHGQRGLLLMLVGQTAQALTELNVAIDTLADAPDYLGRAYLNRGGVFLQQEQPGRAEADFESAAAQLLRAALPVEEAMARHNLGYCRFLRGDLVRALDDMDRARPVLAPLSPVSEATCEQDRAEVLMAAGLVSQGRESLRRAARIYGRRGLSQRRDEARLALARSLVVADPEDALTTARSARSGFSRAGRDAWRTRAEGVAFTAEVELGHRGPSLVPRGDRIAGELGAQGLRHNAVLVSLHASRVLVRRRELDEAARRIARVRVAPSTPLSVRLVSRTARAELESAREHPGRALGQVRAGLAELSAWQASFGSLDLQSGVVGHGRRLAVDGLALAVADARPAVVFEWSERARALASRVTPVRPPVDESLAAELSELRWLQAQQPDPLSVAGRRVVDLQRAIRQHAWLGTGSGEYREPCRLDELQAQLVDDTALLAHVATATDLVALVVTGKDASVYRLGSRADLDPLLGGLHADLDVSGADLPGRFGVTVRAPLVARLGELATLLVGPLASAIGDRRVILTPSGVLAGTPWGLLPGLHGRPVTVARSATSWLSRQDRPLQVGAAGLVAGPRVDRAEAEVTAAASVWPGADVLTGTGATAPAVSDLAARVDVLHVSAHGRHSAENPLFSGVELVDGPWFGYDIDQLARVPDVVLLSACEVGRSQVRYGEELVGMTTAWLHAGARCVIASSAAVNDTVAHNVLIGVHEGLGAGLDPAAALARALPTPGADAAPAPFVCFG